MKIRKFLLSMFAVTIIAISLIGCPTPSPIPIPEAEKPVTEITVTGTGLATTVMDSSTLQMGVAVLPVDASDSSVTWSVVAVTGTADIDQTGLLTGTGAGTVIVKATANDGSGVIGTSDITVYDIVLTPVIINKDVILGVKAPAKDAVPCSGIMESTQYTGSVVWSPITDKFVGDTEYTATITLAPKAGFTLVGVAVDFFTVAGANPVTNDSGSGVVTAVFPVTSDVATLARVELGTAGNYAILAETTITSVEGSGTHITGDLGLSPAKKAAVTGFALVDVTASGYADSAIVTGKVYASDMLENSTPANLTTAVGNMITAYNDAAGRPAPVGDYLNKNNGTTGDIGGLTLTPGLYRWGSSVNINSNLTLAGDADAIWIFQITNNLNLASGGVDDGINVLLSGGALPENVFWQVAEIVTLGTYSSMEGIILSQTDIVLQTGSSINGRLLAQTQVTLDATTVVAP